MSFMSLPQEYSTKEAKIHILPITYEKDVTYGKGAKKGPSEIIKASEHLEYYDEQFDCEPFVKGIHLHNEITFNDKTPKEAMQKIAEKVKQIPKDKFIIGLGGDHATTIGLVKGQQDNHEEFSILILDAHADMRHTWNNSEYNHACVAKRLIKDHNIGIIGVRAMDKAEADEINQSENVHIIKAHEYEKNKVKDILSKLHKNVYISVDVDVFDPSFIRNTGTPEPGGLLWYDIIDILKQVFEEKNIIAADIVEFAPKENFKAESFALAKLVYKLCALKHLKQK